MNFKNKLIVLINIFLFIIIITIVSYILNDKKPQKQINVINNETTTNSVYSKKNIYLYYPLSDGSGLYEYKINLLLHKSIIKKITKTIETLFNYNKIDTSNTFNIFNNRFKLINIFIDNKKIYLNLDDSLFSKNQWSSKIEITLIKSLSKTIKKNFPEFELLQLLINNKQVNTFIKDRGHIYINEPFQLH